MPDKPILLFNDPQFLPPTSMATSFTSEIYDVSVANAGAIQAIWVANTGTGSTSISASNDGINFATVTGSSLSVSGTTGTNVYNLTDLGYTKIQLVYTSSSASTGTMTAIISGKIK